MTWVVSPRKLPLLEGDYSHNTYFLELWDLSCTTSNNQTDMAAAVSIFYPRPLVSEKYSVCHMAGGDSVGLGEVTDLVNKTRT